MSASWTSTGARSRVSRPDKVYFPAIDATKFDLVSYYLGIGEHLLNTAGGRPALLQRFPDGAAGKSFFQKRIPAGAPDWLQSTIVSTPNGTTSNALVVADISHVVWAVNFGCLGLHLWPYLRRRPRARRRAAHRPRPATKGIGFDEVRDVALKVKELLDELGLRSYPKTTGSHGIHVYVRLEPRWDSIAVRAAAVALARELERRHPDEITAKWWKEERGTRVFVDFNQNAPHKTVFGAWFARPRVGGQVSTPLAWDEVERSCPTTSPSAPCPSWWPSGATRGRTSPPRPSRSNRSSPWPSGTRRPGSRTRRGRPQYPKMPDEPPRVAPSRAKKETA